MEIIAAIIGLITAIIGRKKAIYIIQGSNRTRHGFFITIKSICSLIVPGMGQFLDGQFLKGIGHFVFWIILMVSMLVLSDGIAGSSGNGDNIFYFLVIIPLLVNIFSSAEVTKS